MILSEEVKRKIADVLDSEEFRSDLYEGLDDEKREELGQFYTPVEICVRMIERFSWDTLSGKNVLDPTCGSGNLLIACLIAGADPDRLYGNEYDEAAVCLCRKRLNRACDILGKPRIADWQIHRGNALQRRCLVEFGPEYSGDAAHEHHYQAKYIDDLNYAQSANSWRWENEQAKRRTPQKAEQLDLFGEGI